jgi:hypothetical protein
VLLLTVVLVKGKRGIFNHGTTPNSTALSQFEWLGLRATTSPHFVCEEGGIGEAERVNTGERYLIQVFAQMLQSERGGGGGGGGGGVPQSCQTTFRFLPL